MPGLATVTHTCRITGLAYERTARNMPAQLLLQSLPAIAADAHSCLDYSMPPLPCIALAATVLP
jgi:hypothetical protein